MVDLKEFTANTTSEYIDRRAEVRRIEEVLAKKSHENNTIACCALEQFMKMLENIPVVDAVEVVRCKDCLHFMLEKGSCAFIGKQLFEGMPVEEQFCSRGKKR